MNELRHGVKLKKVNYTKTPIGKNRQLSKIYVVFMKRKPKHLVFVYSFFPEYALTPYEILMDDIRSRRYKLNKVMVDGELPPRVKKDAHDIILDFIRSRPPLKPVSIELLCRS